MISKLPPEIQSAFRTGVTITSLPHCVIELILNSLDANASHIGVRIDLEKYNLQVVDNGCGIERAQLELVGERYMTSKCSSLADLEGNAKYYGFRGEAVASIKDACEAMVLISRPEGHSSTFSKVMKGGSEINSRVSKAMLNRPGNGTTVAVTNLFYNLPVRRHRMYSAIELEQLRHHMQAIALIHPKVSFTLRDDVTKSVVFNTKKCSDIIENFKQISKLDFPADSFVEVTLSTHPTFKINGFVCKKTYKSKEHQYIYVNNRLIENRKLYAYFNHKLSKSFYFHAMKMKSIGGGFSKNFDFDTFKKSPEATTGGDYAIFIINIMCPYKEYDITLDPKKHLVEFKDWDEALVCLAKSADKFVKHDRLLENTIFPHQGGEDNQEKTRNDPSTTRCNLTIKKSGKRSPVEEKTKDFRFKENIAGVIHKKEEKLKFPTEMIEETPNSLDVDVNNEISTPVKKICKGVQNDKMDGEKDKEPFFNTPSPQKVQNNTPIIDEKISNANKKRDHKPYMLRDKKIDRTINERSKNLESTAARITKNKMNTSHENNDKFVSNDVTIIDNDRRDNNSRCKSCAEKVHKENSPCSPSEIGKEVSCMRRPLSQGHSEHILTQCKFDFSAKFRKRMRFGCVETNNYRTILPVVNAEIYETNFNGFKHSSKRLSSGVRIRITDLNQRKNRTKPVNIGSKMRDTKLSHHEKLDEARPNKVVKFDVELRHDDSLSKRPYLDPPKVLFSNSNHKRKDRIDIIEKDFQIDNHQPFKNLDNNQFIFDKVMNAEKQPHFRRETFKANRRTFENNDFILQEQSDFVNHKIGLDNDKEGIIEKSIKENTVEDLFLSRAALKRRTPIEDGFQKPPVLISPQKNNNGMMPGSFRIKPRMCQVENTGCKTVDYSYNIGNSTKNVGRFENNINAQDPTFVKSLHDTFGLIDPHAPDFVSNNKSSKLEAVSDFNDRRDSPRAVINPERLEITPDLPLQNNIFTNKTEIISDGNNKEDHTINIGVQSYENCSCETNEIISFYKLKRHCCRREKVDDKISTINENKNLASKVDEVKLILTNNCSPSNLEQGCLAENHLRPPNEGNRDSEQMIVDDEVENTDVSDKLFVIPENTDKNDSQTSNVNKIQEQNSLESFHVENDESICSSETQYRVDHLISNRSEHLKTHPMHSNDNFTNENQQFSFYFQPRTSNTLKMFENFNDSQESSGDSHPSQKAVDIQIQLSHSLDSFRRECFDEFSPVLENFQGENEFTYSENQKTLRVSEVKNCLENACENNDFIESQSDYVTFNSHNRGNFFQFDGFSEKRTKISNSPLKLPKSLCLNNDVKNFEQLHEGISDFPISYGKSSNSQEPFENRDLNECIVPHEERLMKLDSPLEPVNKNKSRNNNSKHQDVRTSSDLKYSMDMSFPYQSNPIFHESFGTNSKVNKEKDKLGDPELNMNLYEVPKSSKLSKLEASKKHSSPQTKSISHDILESGLSIIPKIDHVTTCETKSIFHDSSEISNNINPIIDEKSNKEGKVILNIELCDTNNKIPSVGESESPRKLLPSPQTVSIFHDSSEISNKNSSIIDDKKSSEVEVCNANNISNEGGSEICKNPLTSPQTVSMFHESSENTHEMNFSKSSTTDEGKIESGTGSRKSCGGAINSFSPDKGNEAFSSFYEFDVKYIVSKTKINNRSAVSENIRNFDGKEKSGSDEIDHSTDKPFPESKPIGEDTHNYFANATGFTFDYNTDVVNGGISDNNKACDEKIEQKGADSKSSVNNSNFLNNLAGAYNFQLTPSSKSKAENVLKFFDSPKEKQTSLDWVEQILPSGAKIFIHKSTGMSSYVNPYVEHKKLFNTSARNPLLPLGMSPILITPSNCTNEGLPDLTGDQKQNILDVAKEQKISTSEEMESLLNEKGQLDDTSMMQLLKNNTNQEKLGMIQLPFQIASNTSSNCMFSIKHLENAEVIGLLDNRFIVTIINVSLTETKKNVITLFDQHAVDERIRFEDLLDGYRSDNGSFLSSDLVSPISVTVDHNHMKIIEEFIAKFEFIGLKFKIHNDTLTVTSVPKCLLKRAEKESSCQCKELLEQGIKNLLHEQIETLLKTGGVVQSKPVTLTSIIAYEACRGAIKFGDAISLTTAQCLLKKLSQCRAPYQCAHGRPVLAPIIELPTN